MIRIAFLYYRYIFNKKMILIFCILILSYTFSMLYSSGIFDGFSYIDMYRNEYRILYVDEFVVLTKLISVIFSVFVVILLNRESCLDIAKYIVDRPIRRLHLVLGRIITTVLVTLITVSLFFLIFLIINLFLTPYVFDKEMFISLYKGISLQVLTYTFITFLVMSIFPNIFLTFIPIVLFWYMEINISRDLITTSDFIKIIYEYIPNLVKLDGSYALLHSELNYILTIVILFLTSIFLNIKKDIK